MSPVASSVQLRAGGGSSIVVPTSLKRRYVVSILLERGLKSETTPVGADKTRAKISSRASPLLASLSSLSTLDVDACTNHGYHFNGYSIDLLDRLGSKRETLSVIYDWYRVRCRSKLDGHHRGSNILYEPARGWVTKIKVGQMNHGERARIKFYRQLVPLTPKALACFTFKTHYRAAHFESHAAIKWN